MKCFTRFALLAAAALLLGCPIVVLAQTTTISALGAGNAIAGTESIPMDQTGCATGSNAPTCKTTPAALLTYVDANAVIPLSTGVSGNLPTGNLPSVASSTILGNYSGSTGTAAAINPLAVANMLSVVMSVDVVSTTNIATLSGTASIDGISLVAGQAVLLTAQTTSSQNGIWIIASGAWTRALYFPGSFVINQFCHVAVRINLGQSFGGHTYVLTTTGGAITIGTTAQTWTDSHPPVFTQGAVNVSGDCASFNNALGTAIADLGQPNAGQGPCATTDAVGHPVTSFGSANPVVSGTGCSLADTNSGDNTGEIAATGADTCTVTFANAWPLLAPHCVVAGESATVLPYISTKPTTTAFAIHTAAAGNVQYLCGG